ncbi:MAG: Gfo/Idh/MocA family oxidoreductase [Ruminococcaceae bacterium]|nr:Gfo/Idh/MocA family oxidoreductase [Oscillospiraceae bacterium]
MDKVKVGIIGIGNMGSAHLKNIKTGEVPNMECVAVCDTSEKRREDLKKQYPDIKVFDNATDLYKSGLVDAVVIAVPHYDHCPLAIEAFGYGLHVLVEKPAGVYTKAVEEMNDVAKKSGKVFGIMYNQRTNPCYQKIKDLVQSGELGAIKRISWIITDWYRPQAYHESSTWRSTWATEGGGALINQNPHQLDLWQWMFGMPDQIDAFVGFGKYHDIEVDDDVTAVFRYKNGLTGTYITSTGEYPGTNRLEIACDMGRIVVEKNKIEFKRNRISEREFEKINTIPFGKPECWDCEIPNNQGAGEQHKGILKNFADAVLKGSDLLAPGYEGINGLTISNAIHYSAWTGETVDVNNMPADDFYRILQEKIAASTVVKEDKQIVSNTEGTY